MFTSLYMILIMICISVTVEHDLEENKMPSFDLNHISNVAHVFILNQLYVQMQD